jgi:hypothetical protein
MLLIMFGFAAAPAIAEPVTLSRLGNLPAGDQLAWKAYRIGYDYYGTLPGSVVKNGQKRWRKMLAHGS